jgi:hypothetical protein
MWFPEIGMIKAILFIMQVAFCAMFFSICRATQDTTWNIRLAYFEGTVRIQKPGSEGWVKADSGIVINPGDKVKTLEKSRAELRFSRDNIVRIAQATGVVLDSTISNKISESVLLPAVGIARGDCWLDLGSPTTGISLPVSVAMQHGFLYFASDGSAGAAILRVAVGADGTTAAKVYSGYIIVRHLRSISESDTSKRPEPSDTLSPEIPGGPRQGEWETGLGSMENLIINAAGDIVYKGAFSPDDIDEKTGWVEWNKERDKALQIK